MAVDVETDYEQLTRYLNCLATGNAPESHPSFGIYQTMVERIEKDAFAGDVEGVLAKIDILRKTGRLSINEVAIEKKQEQSPTVVPVQKNNVPVLPEAILAQQKLADQASPTLDAMIDFFKHWATRSYDGYHEAVAIWVLSTIAARRVYLPWQDGVWTPFYIMLVATSSTHAKPKAASCGRKVIEACGLGYLLAPDEITPQKLLTNMTGNRLPRNYAVLPPEQQEKIRLKLAFSGQRGWHYDEFGNKLQEIIKGQGYMAAFHGLLKQLYDNKRTYEYDTQQRDNEHIDMPALSIIGTATPACLNRGGKGCVGEHCDRLRESVLSS